MKDIDQRNFFKNTKYTAMIYRFKLICLMAIVHCLHLSPLWASGSEIQFLDSVRMDPGIRYGRLENGLTYYIKNVPKSPKINMDLYVKAGLNHQGPHELDFAHAIEHLAFTTAKHFPGHLREKLKEIGVNANDGAGYTGDEYTNYSITVPSGRMDVVDMGLLWYRDISHLKITKEALDTERGTLRQEVMFKVGYRLEEYFLETKLISSLYPCKEDFSPYMEHIEAFSPKALIDFYGKWYVPQHMGVVIVGEIEDMDKLEKLVSSRFSDLTSKRSPSHYDTDCRMEYLRNPNRFVALEREKRGGGMDNNAVSMYLFIKDAESLDLQNNTLKGLQRSWLWAIATSIVRQRIESEKEYGTFFLSPEPWFPYSQIIITGQGGMEHVKLQKMVQLIQQIKTHGFTKDELEQAIKDVQQQLGDPASTGYWKKQIYRHFVYNEALPNDKAVYLERYLKDLSLDTINGFARENLSALPNDIGIIAPRDHKASAYTERQVRGWINEAVESPIGPPEKAEEPLKPLLSQEQIQSLQEVDYIDLGVNKMEVEELQFSNGAKVAFHTTKRPGPLQNDIQIHGFSPRGALCFPETDYFSAINAPLVVKTSGVGNMDGRELQNYISMTKLNPSVSVQPFETQFRISGTLDDIDKMFQLLFLYFVDPRVPDNYSFERWKKIEKNWYIRPSINPMGLDFKVAMAEVLNDDSIILQGGTKRFKGISKTDKNRSWEIYKELFGDASGFTFILSGDFSKHEVLPIVQKYIGNLPSSPNIECYGKEKAIIPKGPLYKEFPVTEMGTSYQLKSSVKYMLRFVSKVPEPNDWMERIKVVLLGRLMNDKLNSFRYKKGGALYNFSAHGTYNRYLNAVSLGIYLDCTEKELEWLRAESKMLIEKIKNNGFTRENFKRIHEHIVALWYTGIPERGHTAKEIYNYYRYDEKVVDQKERERFVRSLTVNDIKETARKYLREEYMMEFVMRDEVR